VTGACEEWSALRADDLAHEPANTNLATLDCIATTMEDAVLRSWRLQTLIERQRRLPLIQPSCIALFLH
jgi:hypothetical protein